jgi:hypothetical protein
MSPWTIFFSTEMWLLLCGILSSVALSCLGLCHDGLSICLLVCGLQVSRGVLRCENLRSLAFLALMEGKKITEPLRMWRKHLRRSYPPFIILCIFGLRLMCFLYLLVFLIFLLVSLVMYLLLYILSVLKVASRF